MRYSENTKILQVNNFEYAEFIIENSYLLNNENMTIEIGGVEIYTYMCKQILLHNIKVKESIIISLSIYDNDNIKVAKGEISFRNNENFKISKIKVFGNTYNYYASVDTENENIFRIFHYNCKRVPFYSDYKFCNRDCNSYSLPSEYSEYSEETSWNNEEYKWVYDPQ